jgi:hypothetical protein
LQIKIGAREVKFGWLATGRRFWGQTVAGDRAHAKATSSSTQCPPPATNTQFQHAAARNELNSEALQSPQSFDDEFGLGRMAAEMLHRSADVFQSIAVAHT